jgi:apolipoprotein N-acyltransferase
VIFADKVREFIQAGGNVIINPVSDTWFGDSPGSLHHLSLALFRSLENRVPLVRAANSGVSAVVQASGKIEEHSLTRLNQADALVATVLVPPQRSFYALYGDCFLYFISLLFLLDAGFLFGKKRLALSKP